MPCNDGTQGSKNSPVMVELSGSVDPFYGDYTQKCHLVMRYVYRITVVLCLSLIHI